MTPDELIAVIQAYKEGKQIQWKAEHSEIWRDCEGSPCWDFNHIDYRIKPKPHYRPFKSAKEVMEAIKEHGIYTHCILTDAYHLIVTINDMSIWLGHAQQDVSMKVMLKDFTFLDGTPFGKLVEEE